MDNIKHTSNNAVLQPPPGWDQDSMECTPLFITFLTPENEPPMVKSYWKPSPEELQWLFDGAAVVLFVVGKGQPPVAIGVEVI